MFNFFKKKPKVTLEDPVFGSIEFESDHGVDMWTHIPPGDDGHMICIFAPATGPSESQRTFYSSLTSNLSARETECRQFIATCEGAPDNLDEMTTYAINVGDEAELAIGSFEIELSDEDAFQIHRVVFKEMHPVGYEVDD